MLPVQYGESEIPKPSENYKPNKYYVNCKQYQKLDKRIQTLWRCSGCVNKPPLCPGCFAVFHNNM
nr:unnamed protein product [Callosobruchus analis]